MFNVNPLISIIIPVYNKAVYLQACIASVVSQTLSDIEIVIINDGSTDKSKEIIESFHDPRIRLFNIDNKGVSNARNIGMQLSSGEYILFIDADDTIEKDYCEKLYRIFTSFGSEIDILIFGFKMIFGTKVEHIQPYREGIISAQEFRDTFMQEMYVRKGIYGYVCNKFARKSFLRDNNIFFDTKLKLAEDLSFWLSAYNCSPRLAFSYYDGYNYLQGTENSSVDSDQSRMLTLEIWQQCYRFLSPCNKKNETLLRQKFWGLFEVIFLEEYPITFKNIKSDLSKINDIIIRYPFLKTYTPDTILKRKIKKAQTVHIWAYLTARFIYHRLRKCVKSA